jgi:hypothetical protein
MDSIYGNIQMTKVKFSAKADYEYVANFKVLQTSFDRNKIDKVMFHANKTISKITCTNVSANTVDSGRSIGEVQNAG